VVFAVSIVRPLLGHGPVKIEATVRHFLARSEPAHVATGCWGTAAASKEQRRPRRRAAPESLGSGPGLFRCWHQSFVLRACGRRWRGDMLLMSEVSPSGLLIRLLPGRSVRGPAFSLSCARHA
jgi:hypothetical protein